MTVESFGANIRPYVFACCGIALFGAVAAMVIIVWMFITTSGTVDEARIGADRFLTALETKDFHGAYSYMSSEYQAAISEARLKSQIQTLEEKHGKALRHSPYPSFHFNDDNTQVSLSYWERWEKEETTVLMDLSRLKDGWRVKRFDFL